MDTKPENTTKTATLEDGFLVVTILTGGIGGFLFLVVVTSLVIYLYRRYFYKAAFQNRRGQYVPTDLKLNDLSIDTDGTIFPVHNQRRKYPISDNGKIHENNIPNGKFRKDIKYVKERYTVQDVRGYPIELEGNKNNGYNIKDIYCIPGDISLNDTQSTKIEIPYKIGLKRGSVFKLFAIPPQEYKNVKPSPKNGDSSDYGTLQSLSKKMKKFAEDNLGFNKQKGVKSSKEKPNKLNVDNLPNSNPIENVYRYLYNEVPARNNTRNINIVQREWSIRNDKELREKIGFSDKRVDCSIDDYKSEDEWKSPFTGRISARQSTRKYFSSQNDLAKEENMKNPIYESDGSSRGGSGRRKKHRVQKEKRRNGAEMENKLWDGLPDDVRHSIAESPLRRLPSLGYVSGEATSEETLELESRDSFAEEIKINNLREVRKINKLDKQKYTPLMNVYKNMEIDIRRFSDGCKFDKSLSAFRPPGLVLNKPRSDVRGQNKDWNHRPGVSDDRSRPKELGLPKKLPSRNDPVRYYSNNDIPNNLPQFLTYNSFLKEINNDMNTKDISSSKEERQLINYVPKTSTLSSNLPKNSVVDSSDWENSKSSSDVKKIKKENKRRAETTAQDKIKVSRKNSKKKHQRQQVKYGKNWLTCSSGFEFLQVSSPMVKKPTPKQKIQTQDSIYSIPLHRNESLLEYTHHNVTYV